jgi:dihydroorotase
VALQTLTIRRPDDWHVHLRDGEMLKAVAPYTARQFARAIVMPNLVPPVTSVEAARAYRDRILAAAGPGFTPLMTCYLTDDADPDELARGFERGVWIAAKLYPAGATTNSASGVTDIRNIYPALERMQRSAWCCASTARSPIPTSTCSTARRCSSSACWPALVARLSRAEDRVRAYHHRRSGRFVEARGPNVAATVTPQHLIINRNAMFAGGLRPHAYCLPVVTAAYLPRRSTSISNSSRSPSLSVGMAGALDRRDVDERIGLAVVALMKPKPFIALKNLTVPWPFRRSADAAGPPPPPPAALAAAPRAADDRHRLAFDRGWSPRCGRRDRPA